MPSKLEGSMMRKYHLMKFQVGNCLDVQQSVPSGVMIVFASEKKKKPEPMPVESSSGKVFTRKPPPELDMGSPIPVIIEPMDEGAYQLPA